MIDMSEERIIELYRDIELTGVYDKHEITSLIIKYYDGKTHNDIVEYIHYITLVVNNYVLSTYEERDIHKAFDDAMAVI